MIRYRYESSTLKGNRLRESHLLLMLITLILSLTCSYAHSEDIVLGMSAAFTGPSMGLGIELYRGLSSYINYIDSKGGVNGKLIRIILYDDGYDPTVAINNTIRLVEKDKVFALLGYVGTPTVTRILPLLKEYSDKHVILFFPYTGAKPHRLPPYDEFVFNLRDSYVSETRGLVDNFIRVGRKRIAVFYQADAYGRSGWSGVKRALAVHGLKMVADVSYKRGSNFVSEFAEQIDIIKKSAPDAVISIGTYSACAGFIKELRDNGMEVPVANVSFVGSENMLELLSVTGKAVNKDYTANIINSQVVPPYEQTSLPAIKQYMEFMDRYGTMPPKELMKEQYFPMKYSFTSLEGFLDAKLLVEIIKKMGNDVRRDKIAETVEAMKKVDIGIDEPITFGVYKHQGLDKVYYTSVRDGRFVPMGPEVWARWKK